MKGVSQEVQEIRLRWERIEVAKSHLVPYTELISRDGIAFWEAHGNRHSYLGYMASVLPWYMELST